MWIFLLGCGYVSAGLEEVKKLSKFLTEML